MKTRDIIILCLLFASCSPLRFYHKVAEDPYRNAAERAVLRPVCETEWPLQIDTPRLVRVGVDSSDYNSVVSAYNILLDSLIAQYGRSEVKIPGVVMVCPPSDSLRIIRNFLKIYKPAPIVRTEYIERKVRDTRWEDGKNAEVSACRAENNKLSKDIQEAKDKLNTRTRNMWIAISAAGVLLVISFFFLIGKIRASVKLW